LLGVEMDPRLELGPEKSESHEHNRADRRAHENRAQYLAAGLCRILPRRHH
jgi:hypothetical protein